MQGYVGIHRRYFGLRVPGLLGGRDCRASTHVTTSGDMTTRVIPAVNLLTKSP